MRVTRMTIGDKISDTCQKRSAMQAKKKESEVFSEQILTLLTATAEKNKNKASIGH